MSLTETERLALRAVLLQSTAPSTAPSTTTPEQVLLGKALVPGRVRGFTLDLWQAGRAKPSAATGVWRQGLRDARALHSRERRLVGDLLAGLARVHRLLELTLDTHSAEALLDGWVQLQLGWADAEARLPRVERALAAVPAEDRAGVLLGVSSRVGRGIAAAVGDALPDYLAALSARAPVTLRAQRPGNTREGLAERLAADALLTRPTPYAPDGLFLDSPANLAAHPAMRDGLCEVQDEGSQLIPLLLGPLGDRVLDYCAGAGGKTLGLAADLRPGAKLLACDVRQVALESLHRRARRAGLRFATHVLHEQDGAPLPGGPFTQVLVDAPCSGSGVWRRHPAYRWRTDPTDPKDLPALQGRILEQAAAQLAPSGRLVYATCAVARDENEGVVEAFLAAHPAFKLVPARDSLPAALRPTLAPSPYLRLWPHRHNTDAFFGAVLVREA